MQDLLKWFDLKSAIIGAIVMGTIVGLINSGHGVTPAMIAAAKQAVYTFFFAGLIVQFCRYLAAFNIPTIQAISLATLLPTVVTAILIVLVHYSKGTPEPFLSSLPAVLIGVVAYFIVSRNVIVELKEAEPAKATASPAAAPKTG